MNSSMKRPVFLLLILLVGVVLPAIGQGAKLDLSKLDKLKDKAANITDVSLDGPMLQLAAQAMGKEGDDAQTRDFIKNLKGVYVRVFEFDKDNQFSMEDVSAIRAQLQNSAWSRAINVREEKTHETTEVYFMKEGESVVGLVVLAAEPRELTVVNVIGPIDLQKLGALGNLGVPQLKPREKPKPVAASHPTTTPADKKPAAPPDKKPVAAPDNKPTTPPDKKPAPAPDNK